MDQSITVRVVIEWRFSGSKWNALPEPCSKLLCNSFFSLISGKHALAFSFSAEPCVLFVKKAGERAENRICRCKKS